RHHELLNKIQTAHAREGVRQDAAPQIRGELREAARAHPVTSATSTANWPSPSKRAELNVPVNELTAVPNVPSLRPGCTRTVPPRWSFASATS
ncbi:MAG: hypothetical protein M3619_30530, partial [Myxococcota bacterium]|nr:hypothetical protein [Myxococcota bacterium]